MSTEQPDITNSAANDAERSPVLHRIAVKRFRAALSYGVTVQNAFDMAIESSGLGLNQISDFEMEVKRRFGTDWSKGI